MGIFDLFKTSKQECNLSNPFSKYKILTIKSLDEDLKLCKSKTDDGEQLVWLPLEEIALQEIKPTFLKENINNIINEKNIIHIIEERDR